MFILPAAPASFAATVAAFPEPTWLDTLRLPLALLASLLLLALARHLLPRPDLAFALHFPEKLVSVPSKASPALPAAESAAHPSGLRLPWFLRLSLETLPLSAPSTPATKTTPTPAPTPTSKSLPSTPPRPALSAPHGRAPLRAGSVRRPEPALAPHLCVGVEAPLPALYACQTPASVAKMIMSRHTYRRPAPPKPRQPRALSPSPAVPRPTSPALSSSSSSP